MVALGDEKSEGRGGKGTICELAPATLNLNYPAISDTRALKKDTLSATNAQGHMF